MAKSKHKYGINLKDHKTTLYGVNQVQIKVVFKDLKKRGFQVWLENSGAKKYRIITLINGTHFVVSSNKEGEQKYAKWHSRGSYNWIIFDDIDDLVRASLNKATSKPTELQSSFISRLVAELSDLGQEVSITVPTTIPKASALI